MDLKLLGGIFLEGILSFLSPCVLPLIPLYMSYLAGDGKTADEEGNIHYDRVRVFVSTLFFTLGISLTFFLLAAAVSALKEYIDDYSEIISIVGGTLLIVFGLHETGIIHIDILDRDGRLKIDLHPERMNFLKAFLLGFVFSLGWSPCIGPMMANALLLSAVSETGYLYILAYTLGMIIPFLITGLFTTWILNLFSRKKNLLKWTLKLAGIILILFGIYMIRNASVSILAAKETASFPDIPEQEEMSREEVEAYLVDLQLKDGEGKPFRISNHKGKYLFLNFTATWCTYCHAEMPDYLEFAENEEVECFYVMSPLNEDDPDAIGKYLEENSIASMTIIDEKGELFYYCGISGYPTLFVVSPDSHFLTYASGQLSLDHFYEILDYSKQLES
ncbi:MAG: redoxin domain-containing protein [Erysipelotrichaceae bacterium]|nr:redoxin domain-containing protein [Erysipelotrichaceae bacterium]